MSESMDEHDQAFCHEAFVLADVVHRFLNRISTQRLADAGLLDADAFRDLVESNDRMWLIRTQRVGAARKENE